MKSPLPSLRLEELLVLTGCEMTEDLEKVRNACRKFVLQNHPDKGGDRETWDKFLGGYEEIKRLIAENEPISAYRECVDSFDVEEEFKDWVDEGVWPENSPTKQETNLAGTGRGRDLYLRCAVDIEVLVEGGIVEIPIPIESKGYEFTRKSIFIKVSGTPIWFDRSGSAGNFWLDQGESVSGLWLEKILNTKKVIFGLGEVGGAQALPGDLVVHLVPGRYDVTYLLGLFNGDKTGVFNLIKKIDEISKY